MILGILYAVTKCILHLQNPLMLQSLLSLDPTGREKILEEQTPFQYTKSQSLFEPDVTENKESLNHNGVGGKKKEGKKDGRKERREEERKEEKPLVNSAGLD